MDIFMSGQPIALTIIFSYLLYRPSGQNGTVSCQLVMRQFLSLNKMIHESFALNEMFWMWYLYFVSNCDICLNDAWRLYEITKRITPNPYARCCFWKKECQVQFANRRLYRQWHVKFSNRVFIRKNIPIIDFRSYRRPHRFIQSSDIRQDSTENDIISRSTTKSRSRTGFQVPCIIYYSIKQTFF